MTDAGDRPREKFGRLYQEIAATFESASADLRALQIAHEEGREKQQHMLTVLQDAGQRFREELALLERHAEWEKLTVAFFGETNAGKSTLIESLRILLDEKSRQAELAAARHDLAAYENRLAEQAARVGSAVQAAEQAQQASMQRFRQELTEALERFDAKHIDAARGIAGEVRAIGAIVEREVSDRIRRRLRRACTLALLAGMGAGALAAFVLLR